MLIRCSEDGCFASVEKVSREASRWRSLGDGIFQVSDESSQSVLMMLPDPAGVPVQLCVLKGYVSQVFKMNAGEYFLLHSGEQTTVLARQLDGSYLRWPVPLPWKTDLTDCLALPPTTGGRLVTASVPASTMRAGSRKKRLPVRGGHAPAATGMHRSPSPTSEGTLPGWIVVSKLDEHTLFTVAGTFLALWQFRSPWNEASDEI